MDNPWIAHALYALSDSRKTALLGSRQQVAQHLTDRLQLAAVIAFVQEEVGEAELPMHFNHKNSFSEMRLSRTLSPCSARPRSASPRVDLSLAKNIVSSLIRHAPSRGELKFGDWLAFAVASSIPLLDEAKKMILIY